MRKPRQSRLRNVIGLVFLIVLVAVIQLIPAPTLTQTALDATLQRITNEIAQSAMQKDMKAVLAYDAIEFKGWGLSREAHIRNPRVVLSDATAPEDTLTIATESAVVRADGNKPSILYVTLPSPVVLTEHGGNTARLEFAEAPVYRYEPFTEGGVSMQRHRLALPPSFKITTDTPQGATSPVTVSYAENPFLQMVYDPASRKQVTEYRLQSIVIDDGGQQVKIGGITSESSQEFDAENHVFSDYNISVQDITLPSQFSYLGNVSLEAKLHYSGEADASPLSDTPRSGVNEVSINKLNLLTSRFSGSAMGKLSRSADDALPYGKIDFSVVNLRQAVEEAQLSEEERNLWVNTLQRITGQTLDTMDNSTFALTREKHGEFRLGNASLQEVLALLMNQSAQEVVIQDPSQPLPSELLPPDAMGAAPPLPTTIPPITADEASPSPEAMDQQPQPLTPLTETPAAIAPAPAPASPAAPVVPAQPAQ